MSVKNFVGSDEELKEFLDGLSDEELKKLIALNTPKYFYVGDKWLRVCERLKPKEKGK